MRLFVTGGAGFIGSNFVRMALAGRLAGLEDAGITVFDALTYSGTLTNLESVKDSPRFAFVQGDIRDANAVREALPGHDAIVHFAAESHVDRSIDNPQTFFNTNVIETLNLLDISRDYFNNFKDKNDFIFHHVSTDEVYGDITDPKYFSKENDPYFPSSPYAASKASSDHIVRAFYRTYGLPIKITNCSNNYGPYQYPEKLIPHMILNALNGNKLPIYGDGSQVRDWLYVEDHVEAIDMIFHNGNVGETYCIGGENEIKNIDLIKLIIKEFDYMKQNKNSSIDLISYVDDRLGHDYRYAIDISKIKNELGWEPKTNIDKGLRKTLNWYLND